MRTDLVSVLFGNMVDCLEYHKDIAESAYECMVDNLTYTDKDFYSEHFVKYSEKFHAWVSVTWFDDFGISIADIMDNFQYYQKEKYEKENKIVDIKGIVLGNIFDM